jgi:hypothetical protein
LLAPITKLHTFSLLGKMGWLDFWSGSGSSPPQVAKNDEKNGHLELEQQDSYEESSLVSIISDEGKKL